MTARARWGAWVVAACASMVGATAARPAAADCGDMKVHKKDPIPFHAFEMKNPSTGETYLPNEEIEVDVGKKMLARDFFEQVNDLEAKLNEWGYSLRDGGATTLAELDMCTELLGKQTDAIDQDVKDHGPPAWSPERYTKQLSEAWAKYKAQIPSWADLYKKANDEKVKVYLPPTPVVTAPAAPPIEHPELKPLFKDKTWSTEIGDKSTVWVRPSAELSVHASKTEAQAKASGRIQAALVQVWSGDVIAASAEGKTVGTDSGSLSVDIELAGQTLFDHTWDEKGLDEKDDKKFGVDKGFDWRFALGPIPMRARIGFAGGIGLQYGYQILPLQMAAFAQPYADTKVYAQCGADIGIAGVGVGGELTLVKDAFSVQGHTLLALEDEPTLEVELLGDNDFAALEGRFYLYAYVSYIIGRAEWDFDVWKWDGFHAKTNMFDYKWKWTPSGAQLTGQNLAPEDITELDGANEEIRLKQFENKTNAHVHEVMVAVAADVNGDKAAAVGPERAKQDALAAALDDSLRAYWAELKRWGGS